MYEFKGQLKKEEFYRLMRQQSKSDLVWAVILTLLTIGISFQFDIDIIRANWQFFLILGAVCFVIYVILIYYSMLSSRWRPLAKLALLPKEYQLTEEGITVRNERREVRLKWTEVEKIKVSRHTLSLYSKYTGYIAIPFRFFESEKQREEVVAYLRQKTGREVR